MESIWRQGGPRLLVPLVPLVLFALALVPAAPARADSGSGSALNASSPPLKTLLVADSAERALSRTSRKDTSRREEKKDTEPSSQSQTSSRATLPDAARLTPAEGGKTVYDSRLGVTWLADANLAATQTFGVPRVNRSGSMDYKTAVRWVKAMNAARYLGHGDWTLPSTPAADPSCSTRHVNRFGFGCKNSALGSLYYEALGLHEPDTAVPMPANAVGPFRNFQPYLYWSEAGHANRSRNVNGYTSFSFASGFQGSNVDQNHLYALPMIPGRLPGTPAAVGNGLQVNPGGETVYDPVANVTWLADANLAATETFGVDGIDRDGSMTHAAALQWVKAMNAADHGKGWLGQTKWQLPPSDSTCAGKATFGYGCAKSPMGELFYNQLKLRAGDTVVAAPDVAVGPFHDIRPYLYWACQGDSAKGGCGSKAPARGFEWSFSFGDGFEGTDVVGNDLYVMVYYPGPPPAAQ